MIAHKIDEKCSCDQIALRRGIEKRLINPMFVRRVTEDVNIFFSPFHHHHFKASCTQSASIFTVKMMGLFCYFNGFPRDVGMAIDVTCVLSLQCVQHVMWVHYYFIDLMLNALLLSWSDCLLAQRMDLMSHSSAAWLDVSQIVLVPSNEVVGGVKLPVNHDIQKDHF